MAPPESTDQSTWERYVEEARAYARSWRTSAARETREPGHGGAREEDALERIFLARSSMPWFEIHDLEPRELVPTNAPPITRAMLQNHMGAFLGDISVLEAGYCGQTSGSTGQPVEVWMCAHALAHYTIHLEWLLERAGIPLPTKPNVLHLTFETGAEHSEELLPVWEDGVLVRHDIPADVTCVEALHTYTPHILTTTPPGLSRLLAEASREDLPALELLLTTTATLDPKLAAKARERFGCPVVDSYGAAEIGPIAARCPVDPEQSWHVPAGSARVEETNLGVAVTTLRNRAMPLVRYLTGDHIEGLRDDHHCTACGHTGQTFERLVGRAATALLDAIGDPVSPLPLIRLLMDPVHGVRRFQLVVERPGVAELRLMLETSAQPGASLSEGARARLPGFDVEVRCAPPRLNSRGEAPSILIL